MKTSSILLSIAAFASMAANAAEARTPVIEHFNTTDTTALGATFSNVSMQRSAQDMTVGITIDLASTPMKGDRVITYTPVIKNGSDSVCLTPVSIYGRTRWLQYQRNGKHPSEITSEIAYRYSERPQTVAYTESAPYAEWMNGATLLLRRTDYGCCQKMIDREDVPLANWRQVVYKPTFRYVTPVASTGKQFDLSGRAYVDFPVNLTVIYPDYRRNSIELAKIIATIDSIRSDLDVTVDSISIKGFASPEGPYDNNIRLAKGRTEALKTYVQNLYRFPEGFITTDYEPEDWEGLREFVATHDISNREGILAIIDSDLAPDPKNTKIQTTFPEQYQFLLATVYPALRHSDYKISYTVRTFTDVEEIRRVFSSEPNKLSLNEMFLLAQTYTPGSEEYNEVFETAVRMFPTDSVANLNAANAAMQSELYTEAAKYLNKAGHSAEAEYARCIHDTLTGNYSDAALHLRSALDKGITIDADELATLREVLDSAPENQK